MLERRWPGIQGIAEKAFASKAARSSLVLYAGNAIAAGFGLIASLIVARELGPAAFATVLAYNSVITTLTGMSDLGLGVGLIRYTAPLLAMQDVAAARPYFQVVFWLELLSGLLVLGLGWAGVQLLGLTTGDDSADLAIKFAVLSAALTAGGAFAGISLLAHKKIATHSFLLAGTAFARLLAVLALLDSGGLTSLNVVYAYLAITVLGVVVAFTVIPKNFLGRPSRLVVRRVTRDIVQISGWLTMSSILTAVLSRLDFFYLYRIVGSDQAGIYGAALQLGTIFVILITSMSLALTPYVSEKADYETRIVFLRHALMGVSAIAVVVAVALAFAPIVIRTVFGASYVAAIPSFIVLGLHYLLNILLVPISLLFIPYGKVKYGTLVGAMQLALAVILYPRLISTMGIEGAAITVLSTTLVGFAVYSITLRRLLREDPTNGSRITTQ